MRSSSATSSAAVPAGVAQPRPRTGRQQAANRLFGFSAASSVHTSAGGERMGVSAQSKRPGSRQRAEERAARDRRRYGRPTNAAHGGGSSACGCGWPTAANDFGAIAADGSTISSIKVAATAWSPVTRPRCWRDSTAPIRPPGGSAVRRGPPQPVAVRTAPSCVRNTALVARLPCRWEGVRRQRRLAPPSAVAWRRAGRLCALAPHASGARSATTAHQVSRDHRAHVWKINPICRSRGSDCALQQRLASHVRAG